MIDTNFQQMAHAVQKMGIFKTMFQTSFVFSIVTLPFLIIAYFKFRFLLEKINTIQDEQHCQ